MSKRIYGLDILRATAILFVLFAHSSIYFGYDGYHWLSLGDGVSLFFVLSGFLIGRILLATFNKNTGPRELILFWYKRWMRTLPAYFFVLTLLFFYIGQFDFPYYTFTQTFCYGESKYFFGESWSLCVEEWFYLLVPLLLFLCYKVLPTRWILFLLIAMIILSFMYRLYVTDMSKDVLAWDLNVRKSVFTRMDSIMFGVVAGHLSIYSLSFWDKLKQFFVPGAVLWFLVAANYNLYGFNWFAKWLALPLESIACVLIIPYLSTINTGQGPVFLFFTFISRISYSIYLLNFTAVQLILGVDRIQFWNEYFPGTNFIVYLIFSIGGAYLLYKYIEMPFMRMREGLIVYLRNFRNQSKCRIAE